MRKVIAALIAATIVTPAMAQAMECQTRFEEHTYPRFVFTSITPLLMDVEVTTRHKKENRFGPYTLSCFPNEMQSFIACSGKITTPSGKEGMATYHFLLDEGRYTSSTYNTDIDMPGLGFVSDMVCEGKP